MKTTEYIRVQLVKSQLENEVIKLVEEHKLTPSELTWVLGSIMVSWAGFTIKDERDK